MSKLIMFLIMYPVARARKKIDEVYWYFQEMINGLNESIEVLEKEKQDNEECIESLCKENIGYERDIERAADLRATIGALLEGNKQ